MSIINILSDRFGLSQNDMAKCLGLERTHINMILKGKRSVPSKASLEIVKRFPLKTEAGFKAHEAACRKKICPAMCDEEYESECHYQVLMLEKKLKKLDQYHAQYFALKDALAQMIENKTESGWRYTIEARIKKIAKKLGPERDITRISLEHFKKERGRMKEKREKGKA